MASFMLVMLSVAVVSSVPFLIACSASPFRFRNIVRERLDPWAERVLRETDDEWASVDTDESRPHTAETQPVAGSEHGSR